MPTGIRIKEIRRNKGLTQKQLGEKCHIAESTIRRYESGNLNPKIETLQKIADALCCDIFDLTEIQTEPLSPEQEKKLEAQNRADEKDIAKDIENIRQKLMNGADGPLSYDGEPVPEEDAKLLLGQIELMMRRLKPINKEKYNPNKNKKQVLQTIHHFDESYKGVTNRNTLAEHFVRSAIAGRKIALGQRAENCAG